jgi:hypothetical protein
LTGCSGSHVWKTRSWKSNGNDCGYIVQDLTPQRKREMKRLLRKIVAFIDNQGIYPRSQVFLDKVVLAHVSKALNVAQSIMALIDAGFPEEAFGVSRTMVEIALNLRYITNRNSEQRAQRFVHYIARWKMELMRRGLKHFYRTDENGNWVLDANGEKIPNYTKADFRNMLEKKRYAAYVKAARKYPKRTSWTDTGSKATKGGAWMMAMEPDKYESVNGVPMKWEFDYDWMYFWTSQYVHATVVSMEDGHATSPTEPFIVRKPSQPARSSADMAAFNAAVQLNKILLMAHRALGYTYPPEIANPLGAFVVKMVRGDAGKQQP